MNLLKKKQPDLFFLPINLFAFAHMTLIPKKATRKRIGVAEGKFKVPDEFDLWDKEIEETFGDKI